MNANFVFPPSQPAQPRPTTATREHNRESDALRASVLDAALELGLGSNSTVADWIFNNPINEEDEDIPYSPSLTNASTATSDESLRSPGARAQEYFTPPHLNGTTPLPRSRNASDEGKPFQRDNNSTPVPQNNRDTVVTADSNSTLTGNTSRTVTSNKLRKRRGDGYDSDAGYAIDGLGLRKSKKEVIEEGRKVKQEEKKVKEKESKERLKEEKERKKKEKEDKKVAKKKTPDIDSIFSHTNDSGSGHLSESTPKVNRAVTTTKKSKTHPIPDHGYETDDGYSSSSGKKKSRFFRLPTKSKAEPPVPPMPDLSHLRVAPPSVLPIANKFASSSPMVAPAALPAVEPAFAHPNGSKFFEAMSSRQTSVDTTNVYTPGSNEYESPLSQEGHDSGSVRGNGYSPSSIGHDHVSSSHGYDTASTTESWVVLSTDDHNTSSHEHPCLNEHGNLPARMEGEGHNWNTTMSRLAHNITPRAITKKPSLTAFSSSSTGPVQSTRALQISLPLTRSDSRSPAPQSSISHLNLQPNDLYQQKPNSRSPSPLPPPSALSPSSPYHFASPNHSTHSLHPYSTHPFPSALGSSPSFTPSSEYLVPSPNMSPVPSAILASQEFPASSPARSLALLEIPPRSPAPSGPLPLPPQMSGFSRSVSPLSPQRPQTSPAPRRSPPLIHPSMSRMPTVPQRGRESPFPSRPVLHSPTPLIRPSTGLSRDPMARVAFSNHREPHIDQVPTGIPATSRYESHRKYTVQAGPAVGVDADPEEEEEESAIQDVLNRFVDVYGDTDAADLRGAALERNHSYGRLAYRPRPSEEDDSDDDKSCYPEEDKTAGRSTMCRVENDDGDGKSRYSYTASLYSRFSILDDEASGEARERFVHRVEAMLDDNGKEVGGRWGKAEDIPPVPKMPVGIVANRRVPVHF